jgi:hypothetical protein
VCGSAAVCDSAGVCGRPAVCGSARSSVTVAVCAAESGSASGRVWQCMQQCTAVRQCSSRCGSAAVRQCAAMCAPVCGSVAVYQWQCATVCGSVRQYAAMQQRVRQCRGSVILPQFVRQQCGLGRVTFVCVFVCV